MTPRQKLACLCLLLAGYFVWQSVQTPQPQPDTPDCPDGKCPVPPAPKRPGPNPPPTPEPKPKPDPKPPRPKPWGEPLPAPVGASVGGRIHPDGTEIACDLPNSLHRRNIESKGLGCCVFRSIDHAANWQNVLCLDRMPEWMAKSGIAGGGYPSKVAQLIPRCAKDRGAPVPEFIQVEGMDLDVLKAASRSGRMMSVTYSRSPTGRYGGQQIAHMVNLVHADDKHFVILDNNYPGDSKYEWLTPEEFKRTYAPGWAVILLSPPPPPPPRSPP